MPRGRIRGCVLSHGSWIDGTPPALGGHQASLLGFTDPTTLTDVLPPQNLAAPAVVDLVPTAGSSPGTKFARIVDTVGNAYYLEYRTAVGLDSHMLDPSSSLRLLPGVIVNKVYSAKSGTPFYAGKNLHDEPMTVLPGTVYLLDADPLHNPLPGCRG